MYTSISENINVNVNFLEALNTFPVLKECVDMSISQSRVSMGYIAPSSDTDGKSFKYCVKPMRNDTGAVVLLDIHGHDDTMKEILSTHMSTEAVHNLLPLLSTEIDATSPVQVTVLCMRLLDKEGKVLSMLKHNSLYKEVMESFESNSAALINVSQECITYAFFSDPSNPDSWVAGVSQACRCGLQAVQLIEAYRENNKQDNKEVFINIGMDKGQGQCGIIGVTNRGKGNLVVEGDVLQVAQECMEFCEVYHCNIIVSESCFAFSKDSMIFRELDSIQLNLVGYNITIHELVGNTVDAMNDNYINSFKYYKNGLSHYRERRWKLASEAFYLGKSMGDLACGEMHRRCLGFMDYLSASPQQGWNGVWSKKKSIGCYANIH